LSVREVQFDMAAEVSLPMASRLFSPGQVHQRVFDIAWKKAFALHGYGGDQYAFGGHGLPPVMALTYSGCALFVKPSWTFD
jgi:hypothetical protein